MGLEIYYENSEKTKKVVFDEKEYGISDFDLFQHEFKYTTKDEKIEKFSLGVIERKIEATITGNAKKSWQELYDEMNGVFTRDVLLKKPGKLYVNQSYIPCFITTGTAEEMFEDWGFQAVELKIVSDSAEWVMEQLVRIKPMTNVLATRSAEEKEKRYPYKYPYRYSLLKTQTNIHIDHYAKSDFEMKIYGPTQSVKINIAGHLYEVEHSVDEGEYMVIDSRTNTPKEERLCLVKKNGEKENVFNFRNAEQSVFEKIPAGDVTIDYPRTYGVDLTIFKKRSEPTWM